MTATEHATSGSLDDLVTSVATQLMAVDAATSMQATGDVLAGLRSYFGADVAYLRHHDPRAGTSRLVAVSPAEAEAEPAAEVPFASDDVLARSEHLDRPLIFRDHPASPVARLGGRRRGSVTTETAWIPLRAGESTTGILGFTVTGHRQWQPAELTALTAIASLFAQVQARILAEDRLRYLAEHDDLTGLHNRRALWAHLDARLTASQPNPVAVLFIDLDRLKAINDYLGHTAGDWFIRILAERLQQGDGPEGMTARLGGDEFVVVPSAPMTAQAAEQLAHRLQSLLHERVSIDREMLTRTVSIGVAIGIPGRDTTSELLSRADQAVMTAKAGGGNRVAVYSDDMTLATELRNDVELHLQDVIDSGSLVLHYLPEVDLRTGDILSTEALVRWEHPTRGLLSPDTFIGVAESVNLAGELGRWVLRNSCADFTRWRRSGIAEGISLRVNVSPVQLVTDGFVESVAGILAEFGLERGSVCLEITESVVVQDIETVRHTIAELKRIGVQVTLDDFGTGYSVLSMLKSLPVDAVKIDRGFVVDLGSDPGDLAIVRAIIALAEAFGLHLIAEGVETEAAAQQLLQHGCHRAQGFLLSHPLPGPEMAALLAAGRIPLSFAPTPGV